MFRYFAIGLLLTLVSVETGRAASGDLDDPVIIFASCAGRFSAEMEHRWLIGRDAEEVTKKRSALVDLVDATLPPGRGKEVLARRIEAKMAQSALLQRAYFNRNADDALRARRLAERSLSRCEALIAGW